MSEEARGSTETSYSLCEFSAASFLDHDRRINLNLTADVEEFLDADVEAYDFTTKPELIKQIAREFYQTQQKKIDVPHRLLFLQDVTCS